MLSLKAAVLLCTLRHAPVLDAVCSVYFGAGVTLSVVVASGGCRTTSFVL